MKSRWVTEPPEASRASSPAGNAGDPGAAIVYTCGPVSLARTDTSSWKAVDAPWSDRTTNAFVPSFIGTVAISSQLSVGHAANGHVPCAPLPQETVTAHGSLEESGEQ